jgi:hypothetical protein
MLQKAMRTDDPLIAQFKPPLHTCECSKARWFDDERDDCFDDDNKGESKGLDWLSEIKKKEGAIRVD